MAGHLPAGGSDFEASVIMTESLTSNRSIGAKPMRIVLACDEGYAMPLATILRSLVEANTAHWPIAVHVLSNQFSAGLRGQVEASLPEGSAMVEWMSVDLGRFSRFPTLPHISSATYARFLIPDLFPPEVTRVLYLDADMLVLDDLKPVWETQLAGKPLGAVRDIMDAILKGGEPGWDDVARVPDYFNAGVLLMDLSVWRTEQVSERAMEYLVAHPNTRMSDQDALNVACTGRWHELPARWNTACHLIGDLGSVPASERPGIAHFITFRKPWLAHVRSQNAAFYDAIRQRTCFARTTSERVRDAWIGFWAGIGNVLRRRGLLSAEDRRRTDTPVHRSA
jgi:lipopolysaccharide biosynthesis glycosyltransferase